ncbi:hypothetical protein V8C44DRAFT_256290 [Trichoderma aethiopicum]
MQQHAEPARADAWSDAIPRFQVGLTCIWLQYRWDRATPKAATSCLQFKDSPSTPTLPFISNTMTAQQISKLPLEETAEALVVIRVIHHRLRSGVSDGKPGGIKKSPSISGHLGTFTKPRTTCCDAWSALSVKSMKPYAFSFRRIVPASTSCKLHKARGSIPHSHVHLSLQLHVITGTKSINLHLRLRLKWKSRRLRRLSPGT